MPVQTIIYKVIGAAALKLSGFYRSINKHGQYRGPGVRLNKEHLCVCCIFVCARNVTGSQERPRDPSVE